MPGRRPPLLFPEPADPVGARSSAPAAPRRDDLGDTAACADRERARPAPAGEPLRIDGEAALAARAERLLAECRRFRRPMAVLRIALLPDASGSGEPAAWRDDAARRVRARLRASDGVFRLDEHHVGVTLVGVDEGTLHDIVARLHRALMAPYRVPEGLVAQAAVRIGHAVCPLDGQTGVSLVRAAGRGLCGRPARESDGETLPRPLVAG